ncbi:MAG: 3-sulfinopropanoyl-CoA desulfinase [Pseudomonadota bacterium]
MLDRIEDTGGAISISPRGQELRNRAAVLAPKLAACAASIDRDETYPWGCVATLTEAGLMGMTIPKALGGLGASFLDVVLVIEEIAKACTVCARIVVEANMGAISAIMAYGSPAQKRLAADLVLAGDKPAICITEPGAGSAATEMTTRALDRGDHYLISGEKHWITGGGVSRLYLIFARVYDQDGQHQGIGGFLVAADPANGKMPQGFTVAGREPTMGLRGMPEAHLVFDEVRVPERMVLRTPRGFGSGFADLMTAYNSQRVGAGTVALGVAQGAIDYARDWLLEREQFGRPIAEFQGLQWMLAETTTKLAAARALLRQAAATPGIDGFGFPDVTLAAQAKLFASETAIPAVNTALQMFGARGYSREYPIERMARDVRMFTIGGGTAEILKTTIAARELGIKLPQTRDGYVDQEAAVPMALAAE